jgi:hypothetical protein
VVWVVLTILAVVVVVATTVVAEVTSVVVVEVRLGTTPHLLAQLLIRARSGEMVSSPLPTLPAQQSLITPQQTR